MKHLSVGPPHKENLGCTLTCKGATFTLFTTRAFKMILEIYEDKEQSTPFFKQVIEPIDASPFFSLFVPDIKEGMYYVWQMMSEEDATPISIMDPYAKGVFYKEGEWRNLVTAQSHESISKPHIPWHQTILYELHVGHFTKLDTSIPVEKRGTFSGLEKKLPYLKQLGITTLELLPVFKWYPHTITHINPYTGHVLEDVWGYNTLAFFALDERYSVEKTSEGSLKEFRHLVHAAHALGIEIVLDVVYNHTGEGGEEGVSIHFKHLAPETYYRYNEQGQFLNCAGTGNTLNTNHPIVKQLIKESLLYWAVEVGVDGFRFDLASILGQDEKGHTLEKSLLHEIAEDPILSQLKLISESWDAKGHYDVGRMPFPFGEWSDTFRDTVRQFVKGAPNQVTAVSKCLMGKEVDFIDVQKKENHAIHYITAHDGFTLWDVVSYNEKHNEANGENNRDGHSPNHSYNWGIEGESDEKAILTQRLKIIRNLMSLLLLSKGTPMLLMGDEFGRTQQGNNNAFCQDNELVWVDWNKAKTNSHLVDFCRQLISLRKQLTYFKEDTSYEISWHGVSYEKPDWSYHSKSIACYMKGEESLFLISNNYYESLVFELPPILGKWQIILQTNSDEAFRVQTVESATIEVAAYSVCLLKALSTL